MKSLFSILFLCFFSASLFPQAWIEKSDKEYGFDLEGIKVLVVISDDFDYYEAVYVPNYFAKWGAKVYYAGTSKEVAGLLMTMDSSGFQIKHARSLKTDLLVKEVFSEGFHMIYFPGGESAKNLLKDKRNKKEVMKMCHESYEQNRLIAGISQGAFVLSEAGLLLDREFTSTKDVRSLIEAKGGSYSNKKVLIHKDVLTGRWPYFESFAVKAGSFLETNKDSLVNKVLPRKVLY